MLKMYANICFPLFGFQAVWLTLKEDPTAGKTRATLDREVSSLEPFLEALPSLSAMLYLVAVDPAFFSSCWSQANLIRAYGTMCFAMALFLKSGPCFFLQSHGVFSGICTWRFALVFIVNLQNMMCKIVWAKEPSTKILNMCCVAGLSSLLSVCLIYKALGSLRCALKTIATYPALVLIPVVGFFTFGKVQEKTISQPIHGLALSWKWTFVNMLMSLGVTTALHVHDMDQMNLRFLHMTTESVDSHGALSYLVWSPASYIRIWTKDVLISTFLMLLLFWRQEPEYGVLLPELSAHVMRQDGELEPLPMSTPVRYTRQERSLKFFLAKLLFYRPELTRRYARLLSGFLILLAMIIVGPYVSRATKGFTQLPRIG